MIRSKTIIHPNRRYHKSHPYDVWKALSRLKVMDKLAGGTDDKFYAPIEIAPVMFPNWDELDEHTKDRVVFEKLDFSLLALRIMRRVEEEHINIPTNDLWLPYRTEYKGRYRARPGLFAKSSAGLTSFAGLDKETLEQLEFQVIDKDWAIYSGKAMRQEKRLAKYG